MEHDPRLRRELKVCEKYRISHSHYLGGPPVWTDDDRAKVEAYEDWDRGNCAGCGSREEWWDPKRGGHREACVADTRRCLGCQIKEETRESVPIHERGVHVFLVPNPRLTTDPATGDMVLTDKETDHE